MSADRSHVAATPDRSILERADAILSAFDPGPTTLGLSDIARRTHLPKATAYRIAQQLVDQSLLERDGTGYRLGFRLFELGQLVQRPRALREAALPFLEDLYVTSRETVHLAVRDGRYVVYLDKLAGHRSGRTPSRIAGRFPLHATATGKAILAHSAPDEIQGYLGEPLEATTPYTIVVPAVFRADLHQVRERGWAVEHEETAREYCSVAAPVLDNDGSPLAALSVTGPQHRLDAERFGPTVRAAARALSRTLQG